MLIDSKKKLKRSAQIFFPEIAPIASDFAFRKKKFKDKFKEEDSSSYYLTLYLPIDPTLVDDKGKIQDETFNKIKKLGLSTLVKDKDGVVVEVEFQITGRNNIRQAIQLLLKDERYETEKNQYLFAKLKEYELKLWEEIRQERINAGVLAPNRQGMISPAPIAKKIAAYSTSEKSKAFVAGITDAKTFNIELVEEIDNPANEYVYKANPVDRSSIDIEAYNGFCSWLMLGDRAPRMYTVVDESGKRLGVISERIPGFSSMHAYLKEHDDKGPSLEELIESDVAAVWVTGYTEENNDMRGANYGFSGKKTVIVDPGEMGFTKTAIYYGYTPDDLQPGQEGEEEQYSIKDAFSVNQDDIREFPFLERARPFRWVTTGTEQLLIGATKIKVNPDKTIAYYTKTVYEFDKIQKFDDQKYYAFLKRILISDKTYEAGAKAHITSPKKQVEWAPHKIAKTQELKKNLLDMPEFKAYLKRNPQVVDQIVADFSKNKDVLLNDKKRLLEAVDKKSHEQKVKSRAGELSDDELDAMNADISKIKAEIKAIEEIYNSINLDEARNSFRAIFLENVIKELVLKQALAETDLTVKSKIAKTRELKKNLLDMPEFKAYLKRNPQAIDQIVADFSKNKDAFLLNDKKRLLEAADKKFDEQKLKSRAGKLSDDELDAMNADISKINAEIRAIEETYNSIDLDEIHNNFGAIIFEDAIKELVLKQALDLTVKSKIAKAQKFKKNLLDMPEFKAYLKRNPQAIDQIVADFSKNKDAFLLNEKKRLLEAADEKFHEQKLKSRAGKLSDDELDAMNADISKIKAEIKAIEKTYNSIDLDEIRNNFRAIIFEDAIKEFLLKQALIETDLTIKPIAGKQEAQDADEITFDDQFLLVEKPNIQNLNEFQEFKQSLLSTREFRAYLLSNPTIFNEKNEYFQGDIACAKVLAEEAYQKVSEYLSEDKLEKIIASLVENCQQEELKFKEQAHVDSKKILLMEICEETINNLKQYINERKQEIRTNSIFGNHNKLLREKIKVAEDTKAWLATIYIYLDESFALSEKRKTQILKDFDVKELKSGFSENLNGSDILNCIETAKNTHAEKVKEILGSKYRDINNQGIGKILSIATDRIKQYGAEVLITTSSFEPSKAKGVCL